MPMIERLQKEGKLKVQTLSESGRWFKEKYPVTPPTSVSVLKDHSEKDQKTVWFNSRFYRANLLWDADTMRVRDIHLFDERIASDYLTQQGTSTQCLYETLPFVDGFRWSSLTTVAGLRLKSDGQEIEGGMPTVDDSVVGELTVRWPTTSPKGAVVLTFNERTMTVRAEGDIKDSLVLELSHAEEAELPFEQIDSKKVSCTFRGTSYTVTALKGEFAEEDESLRVLPTDGCVELDFSKR